MAAAMQWVARVFAASMMMFLPGLAGQWLDRRWSLRVFGPVGFVVGLVAGVVYLISVTRAADAARRAKPRGRRDGNRQPIDADDRSPGS
jgi:hypothetical protein